MSTTPTRLSKQRLTALFEMVELGMEAERESLCQQYGIRFNADGTTDLESTEEFSLLAEPLDLSDIADRLSRMTVALNAMEILYRRYFPA